MTTKNSMLGQLSIPSPCSADWSDLVGDGRRRYCEHCDKNVYDFSKMTATEAVALLSTLRGRVCARIAWRPDGTVLTEEPLPVLPVLRRRASPFASVAVTTLITITASPAGRPPAQAAGIVQTSLDAGTPVLDQSPQSAAAAASIGGTLFDQNQAVIPGARVSLINQASGETRVVTSSDIGEFHFSGLSEGAFTVRVESPGFATSDTQGVKLAARQEQRVDVTMQVVEVTHPSGALVSLPRPLRMLYNESNLIVVARIGESKPVEREGEARRFKTTLHVSSFLKGTSNGSTVDLYHWSYGDLKGPFVVGEEILLFLKASRPEPGRKSRGYEVDDTQYGIKKVAGAELRAYLDRIEELSQVNRENGPVDAAIVEWLVRCAEDPATRWEGAYELVMSIDRHSDRKVDDDTKADSTASTSAESANAEEQPDLNDADEEPDFSALMTAEQKRRLMTALFQTEEVQDRDLQLMELAQHWKEPRLTPFLIEQLHRLEAEPPRLAERLMDIIAAALNDKALVQLAEDYESNVSYPDEDVEEEPGKAPAQTASVARDQKAAAAIQTRSEMLAEFLRVVEVALAERQRK